jgi:WD40 repeat protein
MTPTPIGVPLTGGTGIVVSVVFSQSGRRLAIGSFDGSVSVLNVTDLTHPIPIGNIQTVGETHGNPVAFSPDEHTLATLGADNAVRLWTVAEPGGLTPLGEPLSGHQARSRPWRSVRMATPW